MDKMETDFFNKLKIGALLVIAKPDQLHVMRFLEDYNKNSRRTQVFLKYRYSEPCADNGILLNSALRDETPNGNAYVVTEEF
jgi:hypothetical protein|nr:MAG TPA: hypothetical protein [Caudoviricetes sp.]